VITGGAEKIPGFSFLLACYLDDSDHKHNGPDCGQSDGTTCPAQRQLATQSPTIMMMPKMILPIAFLH
jgi:hypothetical protein